MSVTRWPRWGELAARARTKKQFKELMFRSVKICIFVSIFPKESTYNCSELYAYGVLSASRYPAPCRNARHAARHTFD